jgi:hypothetical protein
MKEGNWRRFKVTLGILIRKKKPLMEFYNEK